MRFTWPTLVNALLGASLVVHPILLGISGPPAMNELISGLTVLGVAIASAALLPRFVDSSWITLVCGIWITLSPAIVGYEQLQRMATNDVAVGLAITVIAAIRVAMRPELPYRVTR